MKFVTYSAYYFLLTAFFFFSCKKEEVIQNDKAGKVEIILGYESDGQVLKTDTLLYQIDAGYRISVVTLNYYLSEIKLIRNDGASVSVKDYHYASLNDSSTNKISCNKILQGTYKGISFNIGIDSLHNVADGLTNTTENNNMIWPEPMGGGYHFLKLEGTFLDSSGTYGFAMHLGKNENLVHVQLDTNFTIRETTLSIPMFMNVNEWFRNPSIYDFNIDGNYSMSSNAAMSKLSANGKDVFHF